MGDGVRPDSDSFYGAVRTVWSHPAVKWIARAVLAIATVAVTTGIWPLFKGWMITRASKSDVEAVSVRVTDLESSHKVDFGRLAKAQDDVSSLTESEQLQWALIRIKRLQMRSVREIRKRIGLEARLAMPNPNSESAEALATRVRVKFDDLVFKGEDPQVAAQKALELVYGRSN